MSDIRARIRANNVEEIAARGSRQQGVVEAEARAEMVRLGLDKER